MIKYIDEVEITNKKVLVRVDYNVSFKKDGTINDDTRIKNSIPTLQLLLKGNNELILMSHLGKPKERDMAFSMKPVAERLQTYFPEHNIVLIDDFTTQHTQLNHVVNKATIYMLENTRFYEGEKKNDPIFSKQLADLAEVFVDDAFGSVHRAHASTVGVASFLPSYGGLLLKKEVIMIKKVIEAPERPVVAIIAGAKVSSKIGLIEKLMSIADSVLIGGAMTNNFLKAQGIEIGKGLVELDFIPEAKRLLDLAAAQNKHIILPIDRRIGQQTDEASEPIVKKVGDIRVDDETLDIGPETEVLFADVISHAKTILWNGPVGYFENPQFAKGSIAIYNAIINNSSAVSVLGGGDTLSVVKKLPNKDKITHISTGGGAMLELIEKGTLPGLDALDK
ncbi:MAG: phosphoglycerate kinase [Candidatus Roizmanbacteria bacterium]|nr:phosphoglycerate kinase [Candidatus Roizmanbacteria bacterium]